MMEDTTRRSFSSAAVTPNQLPYPTATLFHAPVNHIQQRLAYSASPHVASRAAATPPDFPLKRERSPDETDGTPSSQISQIPPISLRHADSIGAASNGHAPDSSVNSPQSDDDEPNRKRQKRNKPTLSCFECVERKTKVTFFSKQPPPPISTQVSLTIQVANAQPKERERERERDREKDGRRTEIHSLPSFQINLSPGSLFRLCVLVYTLMSSD